jgi:chromosome condensin MukBEF ATPase and DNA-binding subunit MukB
MAKSPSKFPESQNPPSRPDKTLQWLEQSRDSWREKTKATKSELKKKTLAVKRARENRDHLHEELKQERCKNQKMLTQKEIELQELREQLAKANQQIEDLKKKRWHH